MIHVKQKVCLRYKLFKILKAAPKSDPRTHSPQHNKKAVLRTVLLISKSTLVWSQKPKKKCLWYKTEK